MYHCESHVDGMHSAHLNHYDDTIDPIHSVPIYHLKKERLTRLQLILSIAVKKVANLASPYTRRQCYL